MAQGEGRKTRQSGTFGSVDRLPSGNYRAQYYGPDGRRYKAPTTFQSKQDARSWLTLRRSEIIRNAWEPPQTQAPAKVKVTVSEYAEDWLKHRTLKDRTREDYRKLLDNQILPGIGSLPLASVTSDDIRNWHTALGSDTPTLRAHAYGLSRTIFASAASDGKIAVNPCTIRGAGNAKRVHKIQAATLPELAALTEAMKPERYQAMILLAAWCALRFGELTELRRKDIVLATEKDDDDQDVMSGVIRVRRGVVRVGGEFRVTTPKSDAGIRDVAIPPHLVPVIDAHLEQHVGTDKDALLFPAQHGGHLAPATLYRRFYTARSAAGRDDLRFHDLRHSGAVLAAATGATLAELMGRLGHSTPQAAMKYQHIAQGRDKEIASALSKMVGH